MSDPEHIQRFEKALCSANPEKELCQLAVSLRDEGVSQIVLYLLFERFCQLNQRGDSKLDAILETMDLIYGGPCAKEGVLYPHELDEKEINNYRNTA